MMISKKDIQDILPLSQVQEAILYEYIKDPQSEVNFEQLSFVMNGPVDLDRFRTVWIRIIEQHDMLRVCYRWKDLKKPIQIVLKTITADILTEQVTGDADTLVINSQIDKARAAKFDLEKVPFSVKCIKWSADKSLIILSWHHIIMDGWSLSILLKQFLHTYLDDHSSLAVPAETFKSYLLSSRKPYTGDYWKNYMKFSQPGNIWVYRRQAVPRQMKREMLKREITAVEKINSFTRKHRITLATFFNACWGMTLQQLNRRDEVIFDNVRSVRPERNFDDVVGLFINTLPVKVGNYPGGRFEDLLTGLQQELFHQMDIADNPVVAAGSKGADYNMLFDSLLVIENYPLDMQQEKMFAISDLHYKEVTKYPLTVIVLLLPDKIEISFTYDPAVITEQVTARIADCCLTLVDLALEDAGQSTAVLMEKAAGPADWGLQPDPVDTGVLLSHLGETAHIGAFRDKEALSRFLKINVDSLLTGSNEVHFIPVDMDGRIALLQCYSGQEVEVNDELAPLIIDKINITDSTDIQQIVNLLSKKGGHTPVFSTPVEQEISQIIYQVLNIPVGSLGPDDDLFTIGMNSFDIVYIRNNINQHFANKISIEKIFRNRTIRTLSQLIDIAPLQPSGLPVAGPDRKKILSLQQQSMLMHQKLSGEGALYKSVFVYACNDRLQEDQLSAAFRQLVQRHEILAQKFMIQDDGITISVHASSTFNVVVKEYAVLPDMDVLAATTLDLAQAPLLNISLCRCEQQDYLVITGHHVIADGVSVYHLLEELIQLYRQSTLPALPANYQDYCYWFQHFATTEEYAAQRHYHLNQIGSKQELLQTFSHVNNSSPEALDQDVITLTLDAALLNDAKRFYTSRAITGFQFFSGLLGIVLSRFLKQENIYFNLPAHGRSLPEFEKTIGLFINTVISKLQVDPNQSVASFFETTRQGFIQDMLHADYSYSSLLKDLNIADNKEFLAIHNIYLNYLINGKNYNSRLNSKDLSLTLLDVDDKTSIYKLSCYFYESDQQLKLKIFYNRHFFNQRDIALLKDEYLRLLDTCIQNPEQQLKDIQLFDWQQQLQAQVHPAVQHQHHFPSAEIEQTVHARFEKMVALYPEAVAVKNLNGEQLSYHSLSSLGNKVGRAIIETYQAEKGSRIILLFEHHQLDQFVALFAVLKSGGIYVPVDPQLPSLRIRQIISDAGSQLILTSRSIQNDLPETVNVVYIEDIYATALSDAALSYVVAPADPAYILYTSGSTGQPKGVVQSHRNILHFARAYANGLLLSQQDVLTLFSRYNFDAAIMDIFGAFLNGAKLVVIDVKQHFSILDEVIRKERITIFHSTPTLYRELVLALNVNQPAKDIRAVVLGGEAVYSADLDTFRKYFAPGTLFVNGLGPTESTITLQHYMDHESDNVRKSIHVGIPTIDTAIYLLNEHDEQVGIWEVGELVYKSDYLAVAYWNNEVETTRKFTIDPVTGKGRVYRSGDLGRRLVTGDIEYVGRKDGQIKISGYRIETGEIESVLNTFTEVQMSVVTLQPVGERKVVLVAHVVFQQVLDSIEVRSRLKGIFPPYMIPEFIVPMDKFPLTNTGKIDRSKLPAPVVNEISEIEEVRSEFENFLTGIWSDILNIPIARIGRNINYFDLGGTSVSLLALSNRLTKSLGKAIAPKDLFLHTTIESQAAFLHENGDKKKSLIDYEQLNRLDKGKERLMKRMSVKK
ncbi:non-ribosomal peptide synthetase [Chitinophaga sp. LS1]|uniref:non-ribosomal peptide synthetase n=1 Tax=Chitinophaga sp. LS1 TaxID=3051176 RepID=UPI002AAB96A6|nr:non-ribosomal peptide synthetase [Chitinophaga sp. LS1]WPV66534.1 amino acid adenylation domain-containing protein [Chitinophaga sp. LS1]